MSKKDEEIQRLQAEVARLQAELQRVKNTPPPMRSTLAGWRH